MAVEYHAESVLRMKYFATLFDEFVPCADSVAKITVQSFTRLRPLANFVLDPDIHAPCVGQNLGTVKTVRAWVAYHVYIGKTY